MNRIRLPRLVLAIWLASAAMQALASGHPWWENAVIYEIYPRSFQDSKGDGTGDLNGITERLDYLKKLGVDAIWIAPIYPSPQVDFGYDISDYENIDPQYGTLADFDRLLAEANRRGIRVLMDMVLNHTSDKHPWFVASASSRDNPKHGWYVWNDGKRASDEGPLPPNNWVSLFGGSAWQWTPSVRQFYYHEFYKQQPDLNWRNPEVEKAMFGAIRFWLDRGVAGFRLDAIPEIFEDPELRDEPAVGGLNAQGDPILRHIYTRDLPEVHELIRRLRAMISSYPGDRVLVGETYVPTVEALDHWYGGASHDQLQLAMDMNVGLLNRLDPSSFRRQIWDAETGLHGSPPLFVFDNHDNIRSWDRYGDGVHNDQIAKVIATLLLTSKAAALMYQGQEIGQPTTTPKRAQDVKDPIGITGWPKEKGRDGERTPMQWDSSNAQAGFSSNPGTWLPVPSNYPRVNVQSELADPDSILNWYKRLIAMRRAIPALREGRVEMLDAENKSVLSYLRIDGQGKAVVISLNMSAEPQPISLHPEEAGVPGSRVTTLLAEPGSISGAMSLQKMTLPPFAAWVASID